MAWEQTIGRVSFINCEPLFYGLEDSWNILPAPPSWLTGHLLRKDCILAPIPAADYAKNSDELVLVPDLAISSKGEVGSVLLFGGKPIDEMETIALPSDSATSVTLLRYLISKRGLSPISKQPSHRFSIPCKSGPISTYFGDRALESAREFPELVELDLGLEWKKVSGHPMVFGVFAARRDSDMAKVKLAYDALIERLIKFETDPKVREEVIQVSSVKSSQDAARLERYFGEVINRIEDEDIAGLESFLTSACKMEKQITLAW